ncbi:MAG: extracellular solute-binding protein [Planctomycetota bacterium]|nr:extracellular solute-binding protein [Planctomycetota bacterium]
MRRIAVFLLLAAAGLGVGACGGDDSNALHIYTSLYPHVIERMEPKLRAQFPGVTFRWYQMGSEQIAGRLALELETGATPCDLLLTSDPFFYAQLAERGELLAYESPAAADVPAGLKDAAGRYATVRVPLMVIAVNHEHLPVAQHPTSFADLADARLRGKVAMADPLKSGTTFTTVAAWVRQHGWAFVEALAANDIVAAGGNSSVLREVESGARPVGVILLENLLPSLARGAPITVVYPRDGAIPVPSPVAILARTDQPELARAVVDFLFEPSMQAEIVAGGMYSPLPAAAPPVGAKAWTDLSAFAWDAESLAWVKTERAAIKRRFREIMRN